MKPNATDPGLTALKLQSTSAVTTVVLTTYDSGGAADPGSNGFAAIAVPAILKSQDTGWSLKGNGMLHFDGTAFPSGALSADHYFRTDLGLWFSFDGTRWLSVNEYRADLTTFSPSTGLAATDALAGGAGHNRALDMFITQIFVSTRVRTTSSGTQYWTITAYKWVGGTPTQLGSPFNTSADAANNYVSHSIAINAVHTNIDSFEVDAAKTSTPGVLDGFCSVIYRLVAT